MIPRGAATVHKALAATDTIVEAADEGGCGVAGWDVGDEDLELPEELVAKISTSTAGDKGFYAVPPRGLPPPHILHTLGEQKRFCELAAYFTQVNLQPLFKFKNYKTSDSFARRLLELRPRLEVVRNILQACEMNESDEHTLCAVPYRDIPTKKFSLRFASYLPPY
ncbi:coatomer [Culex quinquefasciatus]|uniref:Coatomer n=1 Tax=Culex quinquefasciatus TaxID=7176 RepID=B0X7I5_CULQU|nr:coatomer [Culex quinquefasciatus]|eukprot:XP_001865607.1 coatomer [Culex quinquefasciatus]